jgi:membrane protein implicated in regulation of membrane protease activity
MSAAAIFVYGTIVFAIVVAALALLVWGIVNERRDRERFEQGRKVFGDAGAALETTVDPRTASRPAEARP